MLTLAALLASSLVAPNPNSNPNPGWDPTWANNERGILSQHVQLTHRDEFVKAGEAYFSPDDDWIIFQAIPVPAEGEAPDQHYSMYVAGLERDADRNIVGLLEAFRVSELGSANTCGWAHPMKPYHFLFGTTTTPPAEAEPAGYQRGTSKYSWQFPREMEIARSWIDPEFLDVADGPGAVYLGEPEIVFERDGYDAEASWSPDTRHILYTHVDPPDGLRPGDGDIWVYDTEYGSHTPLVTARGYDGGPFFSHDAKRICYRSDRRGDSLLQVMVADLIYDDSGAITGIANETQLTDNEHVNWCPFFTRDSQYLVYATSELGHSNYEIFMVDAAASADVRPRMRVTNARGFDGLPAMSADEKWMMWTAQRGPQAEGEDRPSSQLWIARYDHDRATKMYGVMTKHARDEAARAEFESYEP
ncbi:MAG: hypothetical protein DHS20C14_11040 [Phycisphaeraceae bacterium]|nr:MAG: hypothetical protein DHS20C14_11040 [Phycisphaeraceae bacterium]